jgi:catechol 2,3-dioxygenase-like lactoylglutathione lyase family enzyme
MTTELNHTIVWCHDKQASATFLTEILARPAPRPFLRFLVVDFDNGVSLDYMEQDGAIALQHHAFLISEAEFDGALDRINHKGLAFWADPAKTKPGEINQHFGGRGLYFDDPNGHLLELITRPYGDEADL